MVSQVLSNLPDAVQVLLLGLGGAVLGALINWAIYSWTVFLYRPISPWMKPHQEESARNPLDYVPVIGWIGRRRDESLYGRYFWLRPMLIEIAWIIFLPWFYFWLAGGGLVENVLAPPVSGLQAETWLVLFTSFIALMFIGTFIDFDEHMIPDSVTVTGTLFALVVAAIAPWSRLPYVISGKAAWLLDNVDYLSPNFHRTPLTTGEPLSLGIALGIFAFWIWALMPKLPVWDVGWGMSIRMMYAHAFRPKRQTECSVRTTERAMPTFTKVLCGLFVVGLLAIAVAWMTLPQTNWQSLYGSLLGMAFGGGLIWGIRIVGTYAMGREAMGFGDVTLMAMIGATLGWQAALLAFAFTIIVVIVMLALQVMLTGSQELAFGPYLCAGAVILIFRWGASWPFASDAIFIMGPVVIYVLLGGIVVLGLMLMAIQWVKSLFIRE